MIVFRRKKDATVFSGIAPILVFQSPVSLASEIQCEIFPQMEKVQNAKSIQESYHCHHFLTAI